eukprot:COSAG01_NODE_12194_length_1782_cov_1.476530_3_plen_175_part_00
MRRRARHPPAAVSGFDTHRFPITPPFGGVRGDAGLVQHRAAPPLRARPPRGAEGAGGRGGGALPGAGTVGIVHEEELTEILLRFLSSHHERYLWQVLAHPVNNGYQGLHDLVRALPPRPHRSDGRGGAFLSVERGACYHQLSGGVRCTHPCLPLSSLPPCLFLDYSGRPALHPR